MGVEPLAGHHEDDVAKLGAVTETSESPTALTPVVYGLRGEVGGVTAERHHAHRGVVPTVVRAGCAHRLGKHKVYMGKN